MGGDQDGFVLLDQESLQPFEGREIKMIRRLVEQQEIGIFEQEPRETEPRALPT